MEKRSDSEIRIVPDTSAIIDGYISEMVSRGKYTGAQVFIPEAVVSELEAQANRGFEIGQKGLDELLELRTLSDEGEITLSFVGEQPGPEQVKLARSGNIDALIRAEATKLDAVFITGDRIQAQVATSKGLRVELISPQGDKFGPLLIEDYFANDTMSVHLKNKVMPMAKRGTIRNVKFVAIGDTPCTYNELKAISKELVERARVDQESFIEMSSGGVSVLQIRNMRVAISNPPFSDDIEITAVRPIAAVSLDEYRLGDKLKERILAQRGILIAGPPGAGKSTFAAGVAIYLNGHGFVVKTMESPRDLQVPNEITQYAPLDGDMEKTADVLLLVRPDYTIYDEVRKTRDFLIFADMRLAGVGMIGVVHANRAVDAVQRLIGRVELGVIPQVVDTVVFIDKGEITKVHILEFTVKVPSGMTEADLARPVIKVSDFETGTTEYEIYTYGEQVVVMPVGGEVEKNPAWRLAEIEVSDVISQYVNGPVKVNMVSDSRAIVKVLEHDVPHVIGKGGSLIDEIEKKLGIHIDIRKIDDITERRDASKKRYRPIVEKTRKHVVMNIPELAKQDVEIYVGNRYLFTATVGRHGDIKTRLGSTIADDIINAVEYGEPVEIRAI